jgi:site-specific DNA-methyltransferase (adenine-specific)
MGNHTGNGMRYGDSGGSAARFFYCPKTSKKDRNEGLENIAPKNSTGDKGNGLSRVCSKCGISQRGSDECPDEQNCPKEWVNPPKKNNHPTVKPTELMKYLCRLVTPPGGTVLDPFMGSGSTGKAARQEGFDFIGIELDQIFLILSKK